MKECVQSIVLQSYPRWRVIACYDDDACPSFLGSVSGDPRITLHRAPLVDRSLSHFYNLYCNFLLDKVDDGWVMFLDDDDRFLSRDSLRVISESIDGEDDFILWHYKLGGRAVFPQNLSRIGYGEISSGSACFHSKHRHLSRWIARRGSDHHYYSGMLTAKPDLMRKAINRCLVGTQSSCPGQQGARDDDDLKVWIDRHSIKSLRIAPALSHLGKRLREKFGLTLYDPATNRRAAVLFFGLYAREDEQSILIHQGPVFLLPGGSDVPNVPGLLAKKGATVMSISRDMQHRLRGYRVPTLRVALNLVDRSLFRHVPECERGRKVFVYDGRFPKTEAAKRIYNQKVIDAVVAALPHEKFVMSSDLNAAYEDMPKIYAECRIGLRLTEHDGNANMVQEMEALGIPVVHNQSEYGLKWRTAEDVVGMVIQYKI